MAGGPTTAVLVASVAEAGALGSFGFAYSSPDQIRQQCLAMTEEFTRRSLAEDCGWNANFFVFPEVIPPDRQTLDKARKAMEPMARRASVDTQSLRADTSLPVLREQVEMALRFHPSIVSFHLGIPDSGVVEQVHDAGVLVAMSATSLPEALQVQNAGADFIVAQGIEAGGHRGVFDPDAKDAELGISDLVRTLHEHCELPIIASGGIMTGEDIATIRLCGADAVQMGSAFLTVDECGSYQTYRAAIDQMSDRETCFTRAFSGRPARGIRNLFIDTFQTSGETLSFPLQNTLTGSLRKSAATTGDFELMSLWAGTRFVHARHFSAKQLVNELEREMAEALRSLDA